MNKFSDIRSSKNTAKNSTKATLSLAKVSNESMSKQQQQSTPLAESLPSMDELKGKWQQQIGAAKIAWGKLTEDELLKSEGHAQNLTGLVQERYAITREEADKQVQRFMEKCKS